MGRISEGWATTPPIGILDSFGVKIQMHLLWNEARVRIMSFMTNAFSLTFLLSVASCDRAYVLRQAIA